MTRRKLLRVLPSTIAVAALARGRQTNLQPPKKDVPYLLEASKLVETEVQQATQSKSKEGQTFTVPGATSPARTPLPEPIFLLEADQLKPEQLGLFHFTVKEGHREVTFGKHKSDDDEQQLRLTVRKVGAQLYRIEASEMLDPGEYSLSPQSANTAFCFTVY